MGNGTAKGIVILTIGRDDITCAVALQLQNEISVAYLDTEG